MIAVILAAGISSRLRPLTNAVPKCLLTLGGKPLLQRNLEILERNGIEECVIVTGYLREMIEGFVGSLNPHMTVTYVHNAEFANTNNNSSLWLTKEAVHNRSMLLMDGDILFHAGIMENLLGSSHEDALVMRKSDDLGEEEIKLELADDGHILRIGKELDPARCAGESLGIEKFSAATARKLFRVLDERHVYNEFYEASFQIVIDHGARIFAVDSGGLPCMEIDTAEDFQTAEELALLLP